MKCATDTQVSQKLFHPKYRSDIDGLRAIAVLAVVGYHAFPLGITGGFIGVDIFFVISGYLISTIIFSSLERNSFSFYTFYARRIRRIFPSLILVLFASLAVGWFVLLADEYMQLGKHIAAGAGFVSNFTLWNESGYFGGAAETKPLLHLWSLSIEEQYYIVWPLLLWLTWKARRNWLTITLLIFAISFTLNIFNIFRDSVATFYSPQTRFWELLSGSILAYITLYKGSFASLKHILCTLPKLFTWVETQKNRHRMLADYQSALGILLIASGIVIISKDSLFPGWWAVLPVLGTVLVIAAGMQAWINRVILSHRLLVWFGLISYPLYLWHWPLLTFARIEESGPPSYLVRGLLVLASVVLAWLTCRFVENPVRFGATSKSKVIVPFTLMVLVGMLGYGCYKYDSFAYRFPKIVQELTKYRYDYNQAFQAGTCFLQPDQDYTAFKLCENHISKERPTLLLWGDSHAAHLYSGYKAIFGSNFNLMHRSASGCAPILDMRFPKRPHCKEINDHIFESLKKDKPDKIVLAAIWNLYEWEKISNTIDRLRQIGVTDIDLIGPVPQWNEPLPRLLSRYMHKNRKDDDAAYRIPERITYGLRQNFIELDPQMAEYSKQLGVKYISPKKILCNEAGCLTKTGEAMDTLVAFDYTHLTEFGAQFLVSQFPR